jgi:hypothetical protein
MGLLILPDGLTNQSNASKVLRYPWVRAISNGADTNTGFVPKTSGHGTSKYGPTNIVTLGSAESNDARIPITPKWSILFCGAINSAVSIYPYFLGKSSDVALTLRHGSVGDRCLFFDGIAFKDSGLTFGFNEYACLGITFDGTNLRFFKNGVPGNFTTATFNPGGNWYIKSATTEGNTHSIALLAFANSAIPNAEMVSVSANPWGIFDQPHRRIWTAAPTAAPVTITCSVGNANATGVTALVSRAIPCSVGNANATGVSALVSRSIPCSVGNTNATGVTALVSRSIPCAVGNANATGVTSLVSLAIPCSVGNANATGVTATISAGGSVTITCSVANANATGPSALISTTVQCSVANAAAAGVTAAIQSGLVITTATANALATGIQAAINAAISASVGNANASGVTASVQGQGIASLLPDRRYTVIGAAPGYVIAASGRNYQVTIQ